MVGRDWVEGGTAVLGVVFLTLAGLCGYALVVDVAHLFDVDVGFPARQGFITATKWFGVVVFAVMTVVFASAGWFLAGEQIRHALRRLRGHRSS